MPTSRRLTLLKKFERQVAPFEKHHVDFLGLGEDTRDEVAHLEKKGFVAASSNTSSVNKETHTFGQYGAAVGDEIAFAVEKGHGLERAERLHDNGTSNQEQRGNSVKHIRQQQRPKTMQGVESLNEPKSSNRWFGLFNRRSRKMESKAHDPATMPPPRPIRTLSPRPSTSAEDIGAPAPRRPLSKARRGRRSTQSTVATESPSGDAPYVHQNNKDSSKRKPTSEQRDLSNAPCDYPDNGVFGGEVVIPFRRIYDGISHTFHQQHAHFYNLGYNGNVNERLRDVGSEDQRGAEVKKKRADEAPLGDSQEQHGRVKGEYDGREGPSPERADGEGGSDTDDSVITYNDGTEKGRAKKIRMLERWNKAREEREAMKVN
ncbi:MAG: hypothetical protein Q9209_002386 [Squamulea sp. 1 TL-2023]